MIFQDLCVRREFSAERINAVVNHPAVRPWVAPGSDTLDLSEVVADPHNILLMADGGGFLLLQSEPGFYEVHSQFLPEARGASVVKAATDASRWMFTRTDCIEIRTRVPHGNVAAAALVRRMGWRHRFDRPRAWQTDKGMVGVSYHAMTLEDWVLWDDELPKIGAWFHDKLEAAKDAMGATVPLHDDDAAHDRYVGATVDMIAHGQIVKGLGFYNRWASFAGYGPVSVIADNPVVIDIGDALLAVREQDFEVLLCR